MTNPQRNEDVVDATIVDTAGNELKTSTATAMERVERRPLDVAPSSLASAAQRSPLDLIESTIRMGASLEQTKEVILLARDMEQYDARKQFFRALADFKAKCPPITKTKTAEIVSERAGSKYGYTWAPLDEIDRTISPILGSVGLSYTFEHEQDSGKLTTICVVRHEAGHEQRTPVVLAVGGSPGMSEQQKVASTMQNGRRFALTSALGLSTSDEVPEESGGGQKITEDQATYIADLCAETGTPVSRVLKMLKVEKVDDVLAVDYESVIKPLQERKANKGAK
jgi:hypothetical protein